MILVGLFEEQVPRLRRLAVQTEEPVSPRVGEEPPSAGLSTVRKLGDVEHAREPLSSTTSFGR
jgi:hypothetical protein